ncbi:hypothetical protein KM043_010974 [Ampulex compressa]|nr:hypothetical protein KM043_010974 [Ampulex compressa]
MERCTVRFFSGIGIFILLVFFAEVLARSARSDQMIITDVMKTDENLKNLPRYLNGTNLTSACSHVMYPENGTITLKHKDEDTFLCLAVYDAWYKISNYTANLPHISTFKSTLDFEAHINGLAPGKSKEEVKKFCQTLKGYTPMYKKTEHFVTLLSTNILNDDDKCYVICVDYDKTFNPLCGILAWIKSIDDTIKKRAEITVPVEISPNEDSIHKDTKESAENNGANKQPAASNQKSDTSNKKAEAFKKKFDKGMVEESETTVKGNVSLTATFASSTQNTNMLSNKNSVQSSEKDTQIEHVQSYLKPLNADIKGSTISQNTQDHADVATPDDFNAMEGEEPDDLDNSINPMLEAADQNGNLPEPSGPRDMIRHPGITPNEEPHFFTYLSIISFSCIVGYIVYHNKQKIMAIVLEGRRSRNSRGRRRPSTASYRKLDCTLEEAVTSQCNANVTHVIY